MKKGTFQKSVEVKPVQGKMDTAKPAGGEVKFSLMYELIITLKASICRHLAHQTLLG